MPCLMTSAWVTGYSRLRSTYFRAWLPTTVPVPATSAAAAGAVPAAPSVHDVSCASHAVTR